MFGSKSYKKESKYLQKMMAKYPLELPNDKDPIAMCVLDLYLRDWLEKHICQREAKYRQLLLLAVDASLKVRGYQQVDHPFAVKDMPTYLKPADTNASSDAKININKTWVGVKR